MKIKPQYIALVGILFVGGVVGILSFNTNNVRYLFSRSVDVILDTPAEGEASKPAIESLDSAISEEASFLDREKLITELQKELLETENDPDKALELRRRIRLLQK